MHMHWTTKARVQRLLGRLPYGRRVYDLGQRSLHRPFTVEGRIREALRILRGVWVTHQPPRPVRSLEIGTGVTPVLPLVFWIYGHNECHTYGDAPLLRPWLLTETVQQILRRRSHLLRFAPDGATRLIVAERMRTLELRAGSEHAPATILERCGVHYHGGADPSSSGLPDASLDLVFSNTVLEHVTLERARQLFAEARRVLRPDGVMAHLIDPSDHFAHGDRSITTINFLQFSDAAFEKYNSTFLFQNRVRATGWRALIEQGGFDVRYWDPTLDAAALEQFPRLRLDQAFAQLTPEEACTTSVCVTATPRASS